MNINLNLEDEIGFNDRLKIKSKSYFTLKYLESSLIFSRNTKEIELKNSNNDFDKSNHFANVVGSIYFSVLFLEAAINEYFINLCDEIENGNSRIPFSKEEVINSWNSKAENKSLIIIKYQSAIELSRGIKICESENPCQNIKSLITLRNFLVHYKPDWNEINVFDNDSVELSKLEKTLQIKKFKNVNLSSQTKDIFPIKYLNYECSNWGIKNCIEFLYLFYDNLNIKCDYKDVIDNLIKNYGA